MKPFAKIRRILVYAFATFAFTKLYSKLKFRSNGNCADGKLSTVLRFFLIYLEYFLGRRNSYNFIKENPSYYFSNDLRWFIIG